MKKLIIVILALALVCTFCIVFIVTRTRENTRVEVGESYDLKENNHMNISVNKIASHYHEDQDENTYLLVDQSIVHNENASEVLKAITQYFLRIGNICVLTIDTGTTLETETVLQQVIIGYFAVSKTPAIIFIIDETQHTVDMIWYDHGNLVSAFDEVWDEDTAFVFDRYCSFQRPIDIISLTLKAIVGETISYYEIEELNMLSGDGSLFMEKFSIKTGELKNDDILSKDEDIITGYWLSNNLWDSPDILLEDDYTGTAPNMFSGCKYIGYQINSLNHKISFNFQNISHGFTSSVLYSYKLSDDRRTLYLQDEHGEIMIYTKGQQNDSKTYNNADIYGTWKPVSFYELSIEADSPYTIIRNDGGKESLSVAGYSGFEFVRFDVNSLEKTITFVYDSVRSGRKSDEYHYALKDNGMTLVIIPESVNKEPIYFRRMINQ